MITKNEIHFQDFYQTDKLVRLNGWSRLLAGIARLLRIGTAAYQLEFYERMLNFLKIIGIKVLSQNLHIKLNRSFTPGIAGETYEDRICRSLIDFLFQFEIITPGEEGLTVNRHYSHLMDDEVIKNLVYNLEVPKSNVFSGREKRAINDFLFINDLIQKYSTTDYTFQYIRRQRRVWETLVAEKKLDYEIRLCETLFNLAGLKIPEKIESPFDEDYYTESGQNAFKNFTRFRFLNFLREITHGNNHLKVFDLGCGYGNYIDVVHENFLDATITGIEKNPQVFAETRKRFEKVGNVEILNNDFFDFTPTKKYDIILMNYVLFYFNAEEKRKVLEKAKSMLSENGAIVLCQYFSGIENLKNELARKQSDDSATKKIEMYYSNKILYANTLWNDAVDTFSEAVKWDEFKSVVADLELQIESMTNADKFYYSLFLELKAANPI